jgi:hypothetical protein
VSNLIKTVPIEYIEKNTEERHIGTTSMRTNTPTCIQTLKQNRQLNINSFDKIVVIYTKTNKIFRFRINCIIFHIEIS